eukprot:GEMP01019482.1.p1 GENE.GEMP01019482.1~~GEMP01019482.1.p1  ORF type:complete len:324 (+),score=107.15 GEMP01019482.1:163-1134(+)
MSLPKDSKVTVGVNVAHGLVEDVGHHELPEIHVKFGREEKVASAHAEIASPLNAADNLRRLVARDMVTPAYAPADEMVHTQKFQHDEDTYQFNFENTFVVNDETTVEFELVLRNTIHNNAKLDKKVGRAVVPLKRGGFRGDVELIDEFGDKEGLLNITVTPDCPIEEKAEPEEAEQGEATDLGGAVEDVPAVDDSDVPRDAAASGSLETAECDVNVLCDLGGSCDIFTEKSGDDAGEKPVAHAEDEAEDAKASGSGQCSKEPMADAVADKENRPELNMPQGAYDDVRKKPSKTALFCGAVTGREQTQPKDEETTKKKKKFIFF